MPVAAANTREVDDQDAESASRFSRGSETFIDSTSALRIEEEIDIAYPRLAFELRKTAKPGYVGLGIARVLEIRDRNIVFDEKFIPPMLICAAHPVIDGWIDRVIGWIDNKLEELSRYAADPSSGGGLQSVDYLVLQMLNREIPVLKHFARSGYIHPERLFEEFLRVAGELATFATPERRARDYPAYDHDDLETRLRTADARPAGLPQRPARTPRDPPGDHRARAQRLHLPDPRPHAVPQRHLRARSCGAPAAHRNSAAIPAPLQDRPQHQDERDRARTSCRACRSFTCRRRHRISARSPITSTSISTANRRSGPNSRPQARSACTSPATGPILSSNCGRSWKTGDERQGPPRQSVRSRRADDHSSQSGRPAPGTACRACSPSPALSIAGAAARAVPVCDAAAAIGLSFADTDTFVSVTLAALGIPVTNTAAADLSIAAAATGISRRADASPWLPRADHAAGLSGDAATTALSRPAAAAIRAATATIPAGSAAIPARAPATELCGSAIDAAGRGLDRHPAAASGAGRAGLSARTGAARRRTGRAERQSDHARRGTAAAAARPPARRADARLIGGLMDQVAEAIKFFERDIRSAGIAEHQSNSAKYVLCATADDIVQHIPTEDRHVWTQYSMLSRFFGERIGGVRFFEILNHVKIDPLVNYSAARAAARLPRARLPGRLSHASRRREPAPADPARPLRDAAAGAPEGGARPVAALAGPGARGLCEPAARAGLGGRFRGLSVAVRALRHLAHSAQWRRRPGRRDDGHAALDGSVAVCSARSSRRRRLHRPRRHRTSRRRRSASRNSSRTSSATATSRSNRARRR